MAPADPVRGRKGETLAADFLKRRGFRILQRNWSGRFGEIDLIAREKEALVFVEVKTRASDLWGGPEEAVTTAKQRRLIKTAREFAHRHRLEDTPMRFDVIAIETDSGDKPVVRHYPDAFHPGSR